MPEVNLQGAGAYCGGLPQSLFLRALYHLDWPALPHLGLLKRPLKIYRWSRQSVTHTAVQKCCNSRQMGAMTTCSSINEQGAICGMSGTLQQGHYSWIECPWRYVQAYRVLHFSQACLAHQSCRSIIFVLFDVKVALEKYGTISVGITLINVKNLSV